MSEDQLQPSDTLDDRGVEDVLDEGYSPPDHEPAATVREENEHETLDERLSEEEPEVWDGLEEELDAEDEAIASGGVIDGNVGGEVGGERTGRLLASESGSIDPDSDLMAFDEGIDGAGASAEEAAVHTIPDEQD